jgi:hypothetical protein
MNLRLRCVLLAWAGASLLGVTGCGPVGIPESPRPTGTSDETSKATSPTGGKTNKTTPSDITAENQVVLGRRFQANRCSSLAWYRSVAVGRCPSGSEIPLGRTEAPSPSP